MPLPNAVIAGVNKAGTTALFHALAQQDGVHPAKVKETHFFDPLKYGEPLPPLERYAELFPAAPPGATVLEATPEYFYGGDVLAAALAEALPGVRVAVVLREPGARAFSWWRFCQSRLFVDPSIPFSDYLARCEEVGPAAETQRELAPWRALSGGEYSAYLPAWQKTFGDRLLVLFYDDLRADFEGTVQTVARHWGVPLHTPVASRQDNVTTDVRYASLQRVALSVNHAAERLWRYTPGLKSTARSLYYRVNARPQQQRLEEADREWLTAYYADERAALRSLLPPEGWPAWLRTDA